jgi:hypothetical protein
LHQELLKRQAKSRLPKEYLGKKSGTPMNLKGQVNVVREAVPVCVKKPDFNKK